MGNVQFNGARTRCVVNVCGFAKDIVKIGVYIELKRSRTGIPTEQARLRKPKPARKSPFLGLVFSKAPNLYSGEIYRVQKYPFSSPWQKSKPWF